MIKSSDVIFRTFIINNNINELLVDNVLITRYHKIFFRGLNLIEKQSYVSYKKIIKIHHVTSHISRDRATIYYICQIVVYWQCDPCKISYARTPILRILIEVAQPCSQIIWVKNSIFAYVWRHSDNKIQSNFFSLILWHNLIDSKSNKPSINDLHLMVWSGHDAT